MGAFVTTLIAFLLTPVYIHYIGVGAYGIIGFYATLQAIFIFLDLGIGVALNREMARHYHNPAQAVYLRNLSHSLQVVYIAMGLFIGILMFIAAPYFANDWFKSNDLPANAVQEAFVIFAITIFARWPYGLYTSGLRGMQHQVTLNVYELIFNLVKSIGSWLVLKYVSPTLSAFLWYQFIITLLQTLGIFALFWNYIRSPLNPVQFDRGILKNLSRYAAGMGVGIILANLVSQMDKVIVSKMVSDTAFGHYSIANNISLLVYSISLPIYMAIFPHFTKLVQEKNESRLQSDFHYYARLLSTLLIPFGLFVIFNANDVLLLWMKNETIASESAPILRWLMASTVCSALLMPVHTLLMAKVKIRFLIYTQIGQLVFMFPVVYFLVLKYGEAGGAMGMFLLYILSILIQAPLIFKTTGMNQLTIRWLLKDLLTFVIPATILGWFFKELVYPYLSQSHVSKIFYLIIFLASMYLTTFVFNRLLFLQLLNKARALVNSKT